MSNEPENKYVAQGAVAWQEKEIHERIMYELSEVYGCPDSYFLINGYYRYWSLKVLPFKRAVEIAERGNHEEILYMIHQYGKSICPKDQRNYLQAVHEPVLPDDVQVIIAKRNDPEEMNAFIQYWGFDARGQDIILKRGDHEEIMHYLERHGLQPNQQHALYWRKNQDELDLHIKKHGLCSSMLDDIFNRLKEGNTKDFYHFINLHELPVTHQIKMIELANSKEFKAYVDIYGLWEETHGHLMEYRSMNDMLYYLSKHHHLEKNAERMFASRASTAGRKFYLKVKAGDKIPFIQHLLRIRPLDYEVLTDAFINFDTSGATDPKDMELMRSGSHEEVMERIKDTKNPLSKQAFIALFFRNNSEEFEACLSINNYYLR